MSDEEVITTPRFPTLLDYGVAVLNTHDSIEKAMVCDISSNCYILCLFPVIKKHVTVPNDLNVVTYVFVCSSHMKHHDSSLQMQSLLVINSQLLCWQINLLDHCS